MKDGKNLKSKTDVTSAKKNAAEYSSTALFVLIGLCLSALLLFVGFIVAACVCEFGSDEAVQEVFGVYAKALA